MDHKETLVYSKRVETKDSQCITLFDLSWKECIKPLTFFTDVHVSANDWENTVGIKITKKFEENRQIRNVESVNNEEHLDFQSKIVTSRLIHDWLEISLL